MFQKKYSRKMFQKNCSEIFWKNVSKCSEKIFRKMFLNVPEKCS